MANNKTTKCFPLRGCLGRKGTEAISGDEQVTARTSVRASPLGTTSLPNRVQDRERSTPQLTSDSGHLSTSEALQPSATNTQSRSGRIDQNPEAPGQRQETSALPLRSRVDRNSPRAGSDKDRQRRAMPGQPLQSTFRLSERRFGREPPRASSDNTTHPGEASKPDYTVRERPNNVRRATGGSNAGSSSRSIGVAPPAPNVRRSGITIIHEPENDIPTVDIVFVHGLSGHPHNTWHETTSKKFWPRDLLRVSVPSARIMTWGYNADAVKFFSPLSKNNIRGFAEDLIQDLAAHRVEERSRHRHIIFVAHSLGGLLTKQALHWSSSQPHKHMEEIGQHALGIVFLGTPHRGSDFGKSLKNILMAMRVPLKGQLIDDLLPESTILSGLEDDFMAWLEKSRPSGSQTPLHISCFWEENPLPFLNKVVVTRDSAKLGMYPRMSIPANHMGMVKFSGFSDVGYERVLSEIKRWLDSKGQQAQNSRGIAEQEKACLQSLYFREMDQRRFEIENASEGTCCWPTKQRIFQQWCTQPNHNILWVKGHPGTGKSVLMKHLFTSHGQRDPRSRIIKLAFFHYARGARLQHTALGMFRSLLHQLLKQSRSRLAEFSELFSRKCGDQGEFGSAWEWHESELQNLFQKFLSDTAATTPVWIFMDALDECDDKTIKSMARFFEGLVAQRPQVNVKVCISCRYSPSGLSKSPDYISLEHENGDDIVAYVRNCLTTEDIGKAKADRISERLDQKNDGIFLWTKLVLDRALLQDRDGRSMDYILSQIDSTPPELDSLFKEIVQKIPEHELRLALRLFQWVLCAREILSTPLLRWAMAFGEKTSFTTLIALRTDPDFIESDEDMKRRILALSGGLIEATYSKRCFATGEFQTESASTVQFIHESVRNYLMSGGLRDLDTASTSNGMAIGQANSQVARSCLRCIVIRGGSTLLGHRDLQRAFNIAGANKGSGSEDDWTCSYDRYPVELAVYGEQNWSGHARQAEESQIDQGDCFDFAIQASPNFVVTELPGNKIKYSMRICDGTKTHLHYAAQHGLTSVLTHNLSQISNVRACLTSRCGRGMDPLAYAARHGQVAALQLILRTEADFFYQRTDRGAINIPNRYGDLPLALAISSGHEPIVEILMNLPEVNVNQENCQGRTGLDFAICARQTSMISFLTKLPAVDVNHIDHFGNTALLHFIEAWAADIRTKPCHQWRDPSRYEKPDYLSKKGSELGPHIFKKLLARKDLDVNHGSELSPHIFKKLLARKDLDVNHESADGMIALNLIMQTPVLGGRSKESEIEQLHMLTMLLNHNNINIRFKEEEGHNAVLLAIKHHHTDTTRLLLDNLGHNIIYGPHALLCAARFGHLAVVEMLLARDDLDPNTQNSYGRTALMIATIHSEAAVIELLLSRPDVIVNRTDKNGQTSLAYALMDFNLKTPLRQEWMFLRDLQSKSIRVRKPKVIAGLNMLGCISDEIEHCHDLPSSVETQKKRAAIAKMLRAHGAI